jgi:flagellar biosynthesis protein
MFRGKKEKKAALIKYLKENLDTPVISALGNGKFADELIKKAIENGVKIVKNEDFFKFESLFKSGREIPHEVYKIVADIILAILETNKKMEEKWRKSF